LQKNLYRADAGAMASVSTRRVILRLNARLYAANPAIKFDMLSNHSAVLLDDI
jgi:hypothetical protein